VPLESPGIFGIVTKVSVFAASTNVKTYDLVLAKLAIDPEYVPASEEFALNCKDAGFIYAVPYIKRLKLSPSIGW
jgi:hypothetical protein